MKHFRFATISVATFAVLTLATGELHAQSAASAVQGGTEAKPKKAATPRAGDRVTLDFANADIEAVARTIATITGRNVVVDPRVKGTVSLASDRPVTPQMAFNQFLAALRLQGFTVVENSGLYKVVPEADAKIQGGSVAIGDANATSRIPGNQIVTQIFRLNFESANNLVPILRPLISPNNTINVNPGNNSLVITDYAENLQRMGRIIASMDVANATDLEIIPLRHAIASDLAPLILRLIEAGGAGTAGAGGQPDTSFRTTIAVEGRSNALIVRAANPARIALVKSLVAKLDQPSSSSPTGNVYVVYLKNADATKLAAVLRATISGQSGATISAGAPPAAGAATPAANTAGLSPTGGATSGGASGSFSSSGGAQPSTGGQIQADPSLNALIITASEPQYRQLRAVIDRLDGRRAQVFVESLIVEVNADKAAQFGIQLQSLLGNRGASTLGALGTNFGNAGTNVLTLQTGAASGNVSLGQGFNLGVASRQSNGAYVLNALANFLETNGAGNILSTPNLLTLDNEEAKIIIGQNVPFVTGSFTNTGGTGGSVNPFQTVERKDVGLTLRVKPQISEDGTIKMQIFQEVSSVDPASVSSAQGLTTNKRSIESNVLVNDGSIVVLGGLITDEYSGNVQQVPLLGSLPVVGNLFKSQNRSRKRTNLMVFLRPVVVRDADSTERLAVDRYDFMRKKEIDGQPEPSVLVPINESAVLPLRSSGRLPLKVPAK
ncbi:MAG TPA: type II secretion system secretin GspD [Burkholderiaceae bacterium]